jgi:hypothetical protein
MKTIRDQVWIDIWDLRCDVLGVSYEKLSQYIGRSLLNGVHNSIYEGVWIEAIQRRIVVYLKEIFYI